MTAAPVLLAPAGSLEAVRAALEAGADAVYVGLKGWSRGGARRELDWEQLVVARRLVASADRKLQVAINTIPKPRERFRLFERVAALRDLEVDSVIVNDVGTLAELRRRFPDLPLTASIGCGARTVFDVAFFRDLGAAAVVLPGTVGPEEVREIRAVGEICLEIMLHMVDEFVLLGKCWMPSYVHLKPSPLTAGLPPGAERESDLQRQTGSVKRGGVGACFRICQQPWELHGPGRPTDSVLFPGRQISRVAEVRAYAEAGADVLKLQGRSLPVGLLAPLVRRYREAIDGRGVGEAALPARLPETWAVVGR